MAGLPAAHLTRDTTVVSLPYQTARPYRGGVLSRIFTAIGRHRRAVIAAGLGLAVVYLAACARLPSLGERAYPALGFAAFGTLGLALVDMASRRARALDVRPDVPAFAAPPEAGTVLVTSGQLMLAVALAGDLISGFRSTEPLRDQWLVLLYVVVAALGVVNAWRLSGVELRPDALLDREVLGTLIVPWEALPVVPPPDQADRRQTLPVAYGRPELVRRRGLVSSRRILNTGGMSRRFAAEVIRYYVTHPEHRAAIGTRAEYDRLLADVLDPPGSRPDGGA